MNAGIDQLVLMILAVLVLIIFVGSLYAFFYAIFLFIFSAGDSDKIQKARNSIRYMLLGILLTIFLLVIFPLVAQNAGLSNAQDFTAQNIFNQSVQIVERLFSFGKEAVSTYQQGGTIQNPSTAPINAPSTLTPPPSGGFEL